MMRKIRAVVPLFFVFFTFVSVSYSQQPRLDKKGNLVSMDDVDLSKMVQRLPVQNTFIDPGYNIWCGSVIKGPDSKYYMFYSRWLRSSGHEGWITHSEIALAKSDKPGGPYQHVKVIFKPRGSAYWDGVCTHNPAVVEHKGKYYLYYMGATGPANAKPRAPYSEEWYRYRNSQRIGVAVASHLEGEWKRFDQPVLDVAKDSTAYDAMLVSNPAVTVEPNGRVILMYKMVEKNGTYRGGNVRIGVAFSKSMTGPFVKHPKPIFEDKAGTGTRPWMLAEDPFIWNYKGIKYAMVRDASGRYTGIEGAIAMFRSANGYDWTPTKYPLVIPRAIYTENGTKLDDRLERPWILFEKGLPVYLIGAMGINKRDHSMNIAIPLEWKEDPKQETMWYDKPAEDWLEALPLGNGKMGAMVYADFPTERIQFNESSLITGTAETVGFYQPFGNLFFKWEHKPAAAYKRSLTLNKAIHTTTYESNGTKFRHEYFVSQPDQSMVLMITAEKKGSITTEVVLKDARPTTSVVTGKDISFSGKLDNGVLYESIARVVNKGGLVSATDSSVKIMKADTLLVYLVAATSIKPFSGRDYLGDPPHNKLIDRLGRISSKDYALTKEDHIQDFSSLFNKVSLDLGKESTASTWDRVVAYNKGAKDHALEALFFQYGRYLLISSSRPGGLPANLQGLWNNEFKPAWYSQYTTNINVEMNYWLAEQTNISSSHLPMLDWIENLARVSKSSKDSQLNVPKGWVAFSTNNALGGPSRWRLHRPGSAWLSRHFWEHFQFTNDTVFLRNRAYPMLKELVEYWQGHLVENSNGKLISPDGWSPEHGPGKNEEDKKPYPGASYDQQIVYDLFSNYIEAAGILQIDKSFSEQAERVRSKMLGPQIGKWGQLQEWMEDVDDSTDRHRHNSHMFAVHPGRQITPLSSPPMANAAIRSLDSRGTESTGWSSAWKINIWARLFQADKAYDQFKSLFRVAKKNGGVEVAADGGLYKNLFSAYPPFQMDANFGYTSGVAEMLLQSHAGAIHFLPALPKAWPSGNVKGLKARGNVEVSMEWEGNMLRLATVVPASSGSYAIRYGNVSKTVSLKAGERYQFDGRLNPIQLKEK
jgi:alpha-L-fucosidase 2